MDSITTQDPPPEPNNRLIRNILPFIIVSIPISMIFIFSLCVLYYGTPEFRVDKTQQGLKIGKIHQPLNPVQINDVIVSINSLDYDQILSFLVSPKHFSKNKGIIIIKRDGKRIEIKPKFNPVSPFRFLSIAWPHLLLMFILISLGVLSYLRVLSEQPVLLFLITLSFFATTLSATFPSYFGILEPHIISLSFFTLAICNWVAFGACLHFVFSFPTDRNIIKNKKYLIAAFYLVAPLVSISSALVLADNTGEFWSWLQRLRNIALPFMALIAFAKHFIDYRKVTSSLEKNQIKLIISAYWLSFGPYIIFYAIPNMLFNDPIISFRLVVISSVILPGAYFIALIRYRLLDVDKMISRTVSYFLLIGLLSISYSYFMIFLKRIFIGRALFSEELFLIYIIAIAILFEPINRLISFALDKVFLPRALYRYDVLPALSRRIGSSINLKNLIFILTYSIPKDFHIRHLLLLIFDNNTVKFYPKHHDLENTPFNVNLLTTRLSPGTNYLFCNTLKGDLSLANELLLLQSYGIELIFALRGGTGLSGLLMLGKREDERPYTRRDIQFFTTIANQAGLALENALHYESLVESKKQIERMFSKVVQSEKMAALGEMTTVLAHELKNPLGIIRSSAQYLTKNSQDPETRQELLAYIIGEVDGLESVINNMMGLARYKAPELTAIDLYLETAAMIDRWIHSGNHNKGVLIQVIAPEKTTVISADARQLQQVFLNCITNAEDAMSDGGKITLSITPLPDDTIDIHICDTGPGISKDNIGNAFKKFFTTKKKGMGIGLSVCKQIVLAHNGRISIENMAHGGLKVMINLPRNPLSTLTLSDSLTQQTKES